MNKEKELAMKKGIKLACLYSYGCTMATRLDVNELLLKGATGETINFQKMAELLQKFDFFPFLMKIAEAKGRCPWDPEMVRAYWLAEGVDCLQNCHSAGVLHDLLKIMEVGRVSENIANLLLDCLVLPAQIVAIQDRGLFLVEGRKVVFRKQEDRFVFVDFREQLGQVDSGRFAEGDLVSVHLQRIRENISSEQQTTLLKSIEEVFSIK